MRMSSFGQRLEDTWYYLDHKGRLVPMGLSPLPPPRPQTPPPPQIPHPAALPPIYPHNVDLRPPVTTDLHSVVPAFDRYHVPDLQTAQRPAFPPPLLMPRNLGNENNRDAEMEHKADNTIRMPADAAITHIKRVLASYGDEGDPCPSILEIINSADKEELLVIINHGMGIVNPAFRKMVIPPLEVPGSFRCSRCQKDLKNAKCLRRHEENHVPVKHFACLFCGKGFNDVYDLKRHTRTHTGSLPFTCPVVPCIKAFAQRITMENHMAKVHGVQIPYGKNERRPCLCVCELCQQTFTSRQELEQHKMTPHDPCLTMQRRKRHHSDTQST